MNARKEFMLGLMEHKIMRFDFRIAVACEEPKKGFFSSDELFV